MFSALHGSASQSVGVRSAFTTEFVTRLEISRRFFAEIEAQIGFYPRPRLFTILAAEIFLPGSIACYSQRMAGPVAG